MQEITIILAQADIVAWERVLSGQVGFILATIFFITIYCKVVLPREDRKAKAIERLAEPMKIILVHILQEDGTRSDEIARKLDEISNSISEDRK